MPNRYRKDPFWAQKKLTPGQLQVHDTSFVERATQRGSTNLEIDEIQVSSLIPEEGFGRTEKLRDKWSGVLDNITSINFTSRAEEQNIRNLHNEYGWMSELRLKDDSEDNAECRWIHISNKVRKNLSGVFVGMSNWSKKNAELVDALRNIESLTQDQERFSKHGRMFAPFVQPLAGHHSGTSSEQPILISVPFLDWTVHPDKETPPLRFQVDDTDMYYSTRSAVHPMRSLLQHYYRLEDTSERERNQVFAKHRPWYSDRNMDLKVRRWYGHHPAGMLVDELWVLVVDARHIVTFSSNQSWKSRWPPMQFSSRVFELSVREMRDRFRLVNNKFEYTAMFHAVACLHGAIGMMHRSFWTDMPLPCTERFGGYLSHLQYRIYRAPSTRLVMELLQTQDELNIIQDITQQQLDLLYEYKAIIQESEWFRANDDLQPTSRQSTLIMSSTTAPVISPADSSYRRIRSRSPAPGSTNPRMALMIDSLNSVVNKLTREQGDITSLKTSANDLLTRTIQLVNIRTESHNQAILVFTVITVIFLPLSFMASFFGMNTTDIRNLRSGQWIFWASAASLTTAVVVLSIIIAFYGAKIGEAFSDLKTGNVPHENEWITKIPFIGTAGKRSKRRSENNNSNGLMGREILVLDSTKVESIPLG